MALVPKREEISFTTIIYLKHTHLPLSLSSIQWLGAVYLLRCFLGPRPYDKYEHIVKNQPTYHLARSMDN